MVSIIIPTKNESKNIEQCLLSCQKQIYKNIEIIVVDNFSRDKTLKIAKKYTNKCYLSGYERSSQRNFGASKSKGQYFLFLDADMQLTKNCVAEAVRIAQKGRFIIAFPEFSVGGNFWEKSISLERNLYQMEKLLAAARFFPKSLFLKLKGYDQELVAGEDWDLTTRTKKLHYKVVFANSRIIHNEQVKNLKSLLEKKKYYSKYILLYAQKHPFEFARQSAFKNRIWIYLKNWRRLARDPKHALGFLFLKGVIWYEWIRNNRESD